MKNLVVKISLFLLVLILGHPGFAAQDGVLGTKSIGTVDVFYNLGTDVSITGLTDLHFGNNPGVGYSNRIDMYPCIFTNSRAGTYSFTVTSTNPTNGTTFYLSDGIGHYVPYIFDFFPMQGSGWKNAIVTGGQKLTGTPMNTSSSTCENPGDQRAHFVFYLREPISYPGYYSDTLTLQLDAE